MQVHFLGTVDYAETLAKMQAFSRAAQAAEELWLCEHAPVFTLGAAGRREHVLAPGEIPLVATDRGGQVTYHGPGQVVAYPLIDLRARGFFVKEYVFRLEEAIIRTLADVGITGHRVAGAPGVYVRLADPAGHALLPQRPQRQAPGALPPAPDFSGVGKIASIGLKVSGARAWHGLALNVAMDLAPFARINPCGYAGLQVVDVASLGVCISCDAAAQLLAGHIQRLLAR